MEKRISIVPEDSFCHSIIPINLPRLSGQFAELWIREGRVKEGPIEVSGAGEPPPCALSDTDVNLSAHPAPAIQPLAEFPSANVQTIVAPVLQFRPANIQHVFYALPTFCTSFLPNE